MSELAKALLAFQKDAPRLYKAAEGQTGTRRYKYLDLTDAMEAIRPRLNEHGLIVTQSLAFDVSVGLRTLDTSIIHAETGERTQSWLVLPPTDDMQELGKAITYARRYSLVALLGLVADEDTDGRSVGEVDESGRSSRAPAEAGPGTAAAPGPEDLLPPTEKQLERYYMAVEKAKKAYPDGTMWTPGNLVGWNTFQRLYSQERFGKASSLDLTALELEALTRAVESAAVPF